MGLLTTIIAGIFSTGLKIAAVGAIAGIAVGAGMAVVAGDAIRGK